MQILIGFLAGIVISLVAWRAGSLSRSGAIAAALTGGLIFGLGGLPWAALLLTFFVTSSALSKTFKQRKIALSEKFAKGSQRDWQQVLANGGLGSVLVIWAFLQPENPLPWLAYLGAMATVNADTWATELGVLSRRPPRLITNGQVVEAGTSGGISFFGTLSTLSGAALVGLVGAAFYLGAGAWPMWLAATLGGGCGSLLDSLLGATVQAIYFCADCQKETERHPVHSCGSETRQIRGWHWLNNDLVNFIASLAGAGITLAVWQIF